MYLILHLFTASCSCVLLTLCLLRKTDCSLTEIAFSRRLSCVIGFFLVAAGCFLQLIPTFEMLLFAQLIWGIGWHSSSAARSCRRRSGCCGEISAPELSAPAQMCHNMPFQPEKDRP
jgi:hypothetical protein